MPEVTGETRFAVTPMTGVEVRTPAESFDNTWTMSGYAAVFNDPTILYDGRFVRVRETIDSRAFDNVLASQGMDTPQGVVHFNFGHDMNRAVAATDVPAGQPGSLELTADQRGLHFVARVSRDDPDAVAMAAKMHTGVLRQASFAFTVASDELRTVELDDGREEEQRAILDLAHLFDVCATPQGAYPQTVAGLRSYAAAINPFDPTWEAGSAIRPSDEGSGEEKRLERAAIAAAARAILK